MSPARLWAGGLRDLLPWILAGILGWAIVLHWAPGRWCAFRQIRARSALLSEIAPRPEILRERLADAVRDSIARGRLRASASSRQAQGSDPSSQVAALIVPRLESRGMRLQRVSAREEGGEVLLSLAVQGGWREILDGFAALDSMPLAWKTRRLALRPADGFRLTGEAVVAVPVAPGDSL